MLKKHKIWLLFLITLVPMLLVACTSKKTHHLSENLMQKGAVTAAFKAANYPSNVVFYDPKTTPDVALANFDTSEYQQIDLVMYSDGCQTCNKKRNTLVRQVAALAKKHHLIILINSNQNLKPLRKSFDFPDYYDYPSLLSFTKNNNGKIVLISNHKMT